MPDIFEEIVKRDSTTQLVVSGGGASPTGTYFTIDNNLSEGDPSTMRGNLGLGTIATFDGDQNLGTTDDVLFRSVTIQDGIIKSPSDIRFENKTNDNLRKIHVADPTQDTHAATKGWADGKFYDQWMLQADSGESSPVASGQTVTFIGGTKIDLTQTARQITIDFDGVDENNYVNSMGFAGQIGEDIVLELGRAGLSDLDLDMTAHMEAYFDTVYSKLGHTHSAAAITSGQFADGRISESSVLQHADDYGAWFIQTNSDESEQMNSQNTLTLLNGDNITITRTGKNVTINADVTDQNNFVDQMGFGGQVGEDIVLELGRAGLAPLDLDMTAHMEAYFDTQYASLGHNHDSVYGRLGEENTWNELNTFNSVIDNNTNFGKRTDNLPYEALDADELTTVGEFRFVRPLGSGSENFPVNTRWYYFGAGGGDTSLGGRGVQLIWDSGTRFFWRNRDTDVWREVFHDGKDVVSTHSAQFDSGYKVGSTTVIDSNQRIYYQGEDLEDKFDNYEWFTAQTDSAVGTQITSRGTLRFKGTNIDIQYNGGGEFEFIGESGGVSSVFGRQGTVTAQSGDYSIGQISGGISSSSSPTWTGNHTFNEDINFGGSRALLVGSSNFLRVGASQSGADNSQLLINHGASVNQVSLRYFGGFDISNITEIGESRESIFSFDDDGVGTSQTGAFGGLRIDRDSSSNIVIGYKGRSQSDYVYFGYAGDSRDFPYFAMTRGVNTLQLSSNNTSMALLGTQETNGAIYLKNNDNWSGNARNQGSTWGKIEHHSKAFFFNTSGSGSDRMSVFRNVNDSDVVQFLSNGNAEFEGSVEPKGGLILPDQPAT